MDQGGMYFMRARYYDPATGRFISKDPVEGNLVSPQSQNGYNYANGNPINLSDPLGLWTIDLNANASIGVAGLTTGLLISDTGIYSYVGMGVAVPGLGGGVFYSSDNPVGGMSVQVGGGAIVGGQGSHNYSNDSNSSEWGLTTPGFGAYTVSTKPIICF